MGANQSFITGSGRVRTRRSLAILTASTLVAGLVFTVAADKPLVMAQTATPVVPTRINLTQQDLEFILAQIQIAEAHPDGNGTLCTAPDALTNPLACTNAIINKTLPFGLRQTNGQNNNLIPDNALYGSADRAFPRLTTPVYGTADPLPTWLGGSGAPGAAPTTYATHSGNVVDAEPRVISNLISDQTPNNPAAVAAAAESQGHGFGPALIDTTGTTGPVKEWSIPNVAPDAGFSASYNSLFTLFGQFFDHGLDLAAKGGNGTVFVPLQPDDPLYKAGSNTNFMVLTRATVDANGDATNLVTPYIDNNQTYTSHPAHQVFLREYSTDLLGHPVSTGRLLDGAAGGLPTWGDIKQQALAQLGIQLSDTDVTNVPLIATDAYGRFLPGIDGFPQLVLKNGAGLLEGNPEHPVPTTDAMRTGHAFLDDIAHHAVPGTYDQDGNPATRNDIVPQTPDGDAGTADDNNPATYDDEMLAAHYICGDGRCNENIGLTTMHHVFHQEHNGLVNQIEEFVSTQIPLSSAAAAPAWKLTDGSWNGERIFQAAKFVNEMEYQHIVFGEFARVVQPAVNLFDAYDPSTDPAITAEFAHAVYRFGHSMLTETVARTNPKGDSNDISLMDAFLNPPAFTDGGTSGQLDANQSAGQLIRGMVNQRGEEIDEFITEALRNNLVGLPLDLGTLNITRARSEGIAPLNQVRRDLFTGNVNGAAGNAALKPYANWTDYGLALRHRASLINFVAAYGTHPSIIAQTTVAGKRAAAKLIVKGGAGAPSDRTAFLDGTGAKWGNVNGKSVTGLEDVDLWMGGLAEKPPLFGGMLGSTFNFVFEHQMEALQDNDRLYYLVRSEGLPLLAELEGNTFSDLVRRNTDAANVPVMAFTRPDWTFDLSAQAAPGVTPDDIVDDPATAYDETDLDGTSYLMRRSDGTIQLTGSGTTENHSTWLGTNADDKVQSAEGDDSLWGNDGNDRLDGGVGADMIEGGNGDDILTDVSGDDVISGGADNDVIDGGGGLDILLGDTGSDAIFHGGDGNESFGGTGNDFGRGGNGGDDMAGGRGEDWLEGGAGGDLLTGDDRAPFAILTGEDDVLIGGAGNDKYLGEGGTDIAMAGTGLDTTVGGLGFDFTSYAQETAPAFADLRLPPIIAGGLANPHDRFQNVEGVSGGPMDDVLRGDDTLKLAGHELTQASMDKIVGLQDLLQRAGMLGNPGGLNMFTGDDIVMGGQGSDSLEGGGGNDLIDGDSYLDVRLLCTLKNGDVMGLTSLSLAKNELLNGELSPADCTIDREVFTPTDTTSVDTAIYRGLMADYFVGQSLDGRVTVQHFPANGGGGGGGGAVGGGGGGVNEGADVLFNVERLQFADGVIDLSTLGGGGGGLNQSPIGTVSISSQFPNVGDTLTATPDVIDPDGIVAGTETLTWQAMSGNDPLFGPFWVDVANGPTYTVGTESLGFPLQVVYAYTDGAGNFESVISDPTFSVLGGANTPPAPVLTLSTPFSVTDPVVTLSALFEQPAVGGGTTPIDGAPVTFSVNGQQTTVLTVGGFAEAAFTLTDPPGTVLIFGATAPDPANPLRTISAGQGVAVAEYAGASMLGATTVVEGDTGTTAMDATIALDAPALGFGSVDWVATGNTATEGSDFVVASGTVPFAPGDQFLTVSADVIGDTFVEADETIDFTITGVTGGVIFGPNIATGTITDDDVPVVSLGADQSAPEAAPGGAAGTMVFTISIDQPPMTGNVTIPWTLVPGTAQVGTDYLDASGIVTFTPTDPTTATVVVTLVNDNQVETDENFTLEIGAVTGGVAPAATAMTGTIVDDDKPIVTTGPSVSVREGARNTRTPLNFTLHLDRPSPLPVGITFTTGGGTARAGTDYVARTATVTFAPGVTDLAVPVTIIGDNTAERDETFNLTITGVANAVVGQLSSVGTILDDDTPPAASINNVSITEGNSGTKVATFTITLSKAPTAAASVLAEAVAGTARIPSDLQALRTTVNFTAGQRTATVSVSINGDRTREPNETYTVRLSRASGITLADSSGLGTIQNDD